MNFLQRCWQKRWIRGLAWTAVTLITIYMLLCTWLNWSWGRQWTATAAMLKAEGETLDFRAITNDPVPEAENFCAIPMLKDLALVMDNDTGKGAPGERRKRLDDLKLPEGKKAGPRPKLSNYTFGKPTDLKAWADWLRKDGTLKMPDDSGNAARDILGALSKHDEVVVELAAGLNRPNAQWTPEWKTRALPGILIGVQLPHYQCVRALNQTLALQAITTARAGDVTKAHELTLIISKITMANLNDPFLIGLLVAASDATALCGSVWELCDAQTGTAEDFARLESALTTLDFHCSALRAFRSEMASAVDAMQQIKRSPAKGLTFLQVADNSGNTPDSAFGGVVARAIPLGYFDASGAVLVDLEFKYIIKPLRDQGWQEVRRTSKEMEKVVVQMKSKIWTHPSYMLACLSAPVFRGIIDKIIYSQTLANQTIIACALERHRIEKGSYPELLDAVKLANGKTLPLDVINNKPMGYRKTADGKYALWSVGFDGKDDGGRRSLDEKKPETTKFSDAKYVGDWVWDFPAAR